MDSDPLRFFAKLCVAWIVAIGLLAMVRCYDTVFFLLLVFAPLLLLLGGTIPTVAIVIAVKRALAKRYLAALAWAGVPAAAVLFAYIGWNLAEPARFWLNKSSYDRVVAAVAAGKCSPEDQPRWGVRAEYYCGPPIAVVFSWGGFASVWHGVVYDASDEIMKPPKERSDAWKRSEIGGILTCAGADKSLGGHYYRASGYDMAERCD